MFGRVLATVAAGGGGYIATVMFRKEKVSASWNVSYDPIRLWNHNWDYRDPCSCVKPLENDSSETAQNKHNEEIEANTPKAIRHIFLVRHGQYESSEPTDELRKLTPLGREQAEMTGKRLRELNLPFKRIVNSTMTRATETADIICKFVSGPREKCDMIREGAPYPPEPKNLHWQPEDNKFFQDGAVIEAAFRKYFHRAEPDQKGDSHELLVCHANVIRYFVCRALQLPPEAWLRFDLKNGSITWITIYPNGYVYTKFIGDSGFMPAKKLSNR